ncbi:MAG: prenyltransferase [Methanophagales archaeon ANME-1-THS]|nr:MAG: prenyltransferase [Methanophagales archaeon ANME-1-THS]
MINTLLIRLKIWSQAFRYHFVPPSIFPATIGGLVSWAVNQTFSVWYFFLVLLGVTINHIALNMTDDYFDFAHAVDQLKPGEKNPYTGGSGTLTSGLIMPEAMFKAFTLLYCIVAIIGVYLGIRRGPLILVLGSFGILCSIFYTAPPIKFSHRGLGELGLLINFGPVIGLGSYVVQAQQVSIAALWATLPCGIMLFSMIIINEIPDLAEDKRAGKLTLIARYGTQAGVKLYLVSWAATYLVILVGALIGVLPPLTLIALLSLPLAYRSVKVLVTHYNDPQRMAPANLDMLRAHGLTSLLLIGAYALAGAVRGADGMQLLGVLLLLAAFYIPAALPVVRPVRKKEQARS